jgi:LuxR family maltose regulon positive regulatory protein
MYSHANQSDAAWPCDGAIGRIAEPAFAQLISGWVTPPVFSQVWVRSHVVERLDAALSYPLTLIAAPPGSGKTILLSQWVAALRARPAPPRVVWLTLGPGANEPMLLLRALEAAFQRAGALTERLPTAPIPDEMLLHLALHGLTEPTVLILDRVELLGAAGQALLAHLVDHPPPMLHLVLSSRSEPALPLSRLRLKRTVLEINGGDLRWDDADAAALLNSTLRLDLSPAEITLLVQLTTGWVTGLGLAALALQAADQAIQAADFSGADRAVVDYVASEVLDAHPAEVQAFLLRSATLPELNLRSSERLLRSGPPLNEELGLTSAQAMLEYLERHNLFVEPLDRQRTRYRYQPLIAEALNILRTMRLPDAFAVGTGSALTPSGLNDSESDSAALSDEPSEAEGLSEREQQILSLAAGGLPNREIAQQLWISEATVKSHLKRIFGKLGARNRTEAVAIARRKQLMAIM